MCVLYVVLFSIFFVVSAHIELIISVCLTLIYLYPVRIVHVSFAYIF